MESAATIVREPLVSDEEIRRQSIDEITAYIRSRNFLGDHVTPEDLQWWVTFRSTHGIGLEFSNFMERLERPRIHPNAPIVQWMDNNIYQEFQFFTSSVDWDMEEEISDEGMGITDDEEDEHFKFSRKLPEDEGKS